MGGEKKLVGGFFKLLTGKWCTKTPDPNFNRRRSRNGPQA
jgi:hypothetical protein